MRHGVGDQAKWQVAVIAPPSALNDRWSRRTRSGDRHGIGLDAIRQRARQRGVELRCSDRADWDELTMTIEKSSRRRSGSPDEALRRLVHDPSDWHAN
jgi:hypothetical protein